MARPRFAARSSRQHGAALLILMLIIFLAATSWVLGKSAGTGRQRDNATASAMAQAKDALIGRAAIDDDRPGSLPCPDINDNGASPLFVGNHCPSYIGRLPWKTLRVGDLRDSAGERLWYALAPALRNDDSAQPINPQKPLELTLDGSANIAAIIFSAGAPLANQNGRPGNAVADYLDGSNQDGDNAYVSGPASGTFNDKTLAITRDDIFRTANQRVLAVIRGPDDNPAGSPKMGLRHYHAVNGTFPWADSGIDGFGDVGATIGKLPYNEIELNAPLAPYSWLNPNGWLPLVIYERIDANSARISIGSSKMNVIPCPTSPCP
jgi:hypothetical protein